MTKIPSYLTDSSGLLLQTSVIGVKDINPHRKFILRPILATPMGDLWHINECRSALKLCCPPWCYNHGELLEYSIHPGESIQALGNRKLSEAQGHTLSLLRDKYNL